SRTCVNPLAPLVDRFQEVRGNGGGSLAVPAGLRLDGQPSFPLRASTHRPAHWKLQSSSVRTSPSISAIVRHERLNPASLSANDDEHILQQDRELAALPLTPDGPGYRFRYQVAGTRSDEVSGTIDQSGAITVESRVLAHPHICPICLAQWARIATPSGELPVSKVHPGTLVWTLDAAGNRVAAPVLNVGSTPTRAGHQVVHLQLADGRSVDVSPGHPLADGRRVADLTPGDPLDGTLIASAERRPYAG